MKAQSGKRFSVLSHRDSGVLLHVSSLPNRYGIGDLGPAAHQWVDMLAKAGQRWWQILPLGPVGDGNSPYKCFSVFAGNPSLISPDALLNDGLLTRADLSRLLLPVGRVNFTAVDQNKAVMLAAAWGQFQKKADAKLARHFEGFLQQQSHWLADFALFMALREANPKLDWTSWPQSILHRKPSALADCRRDLSEAVNLHQFGQFLFFRQLKTLRKHAKKSGVELLGDLPIFVSPESVDVWTDPKLFQLDKNSRPVAVAGVPPDQFSATGQRWGNPLYNWKEMAKDHFQWWRNRVDAALGQADLVRIDHFRGFEAYWQVPATSHTAMGGKWVKAPGGKLFEALLADRPDLPLLAEDLGVITPEVEALRDRFGLPGMRVLQFGFDGDSANIHLPHNIPKHCFVYTGTHDNDTTLGWYAGLTFAVKSQLRDYAPEIKSQKDVAWGLIHLAWASAAKHAIVPLQDILELNSDSRMNTPGRPDHNWNWRLQSFQLCKNPLSRLAKLSVIYGRNTAHSSVR